jgi:type IV secretion system protein VirB2
MTTSVITHLRRVATRLAIEATSWEARALTGPSSALAPLAIGSVMLFPALAHAQTVSGGASPATMINNICTFILGPFGQSLAVLGIIAIGLSWMFGRASLGLIAGVIGGIVIMFGASYLGQTLTGGSGG